MGFAVPETAKPDLYEICTAFRRLGTAFLWVVAPLLLYIQASLSVGGVTQTRGGQNHLWRVTAPLSSKTQSI